MKVGDKVRFLNAKGGGVIKAFQSKDIAIVEDEDGFDIPIMTRECVVIVPDNEVQVRNSVKSDIFTPVASVSASLQNIPVEIVETKGGDLITACLVFLPIDEKNISTTNYDTYFVNDSNYFLSYIYMSRTYNGWIKRSMGIIEPNTKMFIEELDKQQLNEIERVCVQFFAYKEDKPFAIKNICSTELRIDTVKFYKLHSFKENDFFEDDAIVYTLMKKDVVEKEFVISPAELEQAMLSKKTQDIESHTSGKKQNRDTNGILEVDLHIDELLDDTRGLEPNVMLDYQLTKFREVMETNLSKKGKKIVFIHGKGNGVLKKELLNELKLKYKGCYVQDASFKEYGFGATMVTIK